MNFPAYGYKPEARTREGVGTAQDPYVIQETGARVKIDDKPEEACYKDALMLELLYESWPGDNTPAPAKIRAP